MRRTLVLKKETLAELAPAELRGIAGAALTPQCPTNDFGGCRVPTDHCVSVVDCVSRAIDPCVTHYQSVCYC